MIRFIRAARTAVDGLMSVPAIRSTVALALAGVAVHMLNTAVLAYTEQIERQRAELAELDAAVGRRTEQYAASLAEVDNVAAAVVEMPRCEWTSLIGDESRRCVQAKGHYPESVHWAQGESWVENGERFPQDWADVVNRVHYTDPVAARLDLPATDLYADADN